MKLLVTTGILLFGAWLASGCNQVDNAVDCHAICERYKDCFDADYDTGSCEDRCRDGADGEGYATKADACNACIDDKSCTSASFTCTGECAGILP